MNHVIQNNPRKHYLMLCELHFPELHGKTNNSDPYIESHYLVYEKFNAQEISLFSENIDDIEDTMIDDGNRFSDIYDTALFLNTNYNELARNYRGSYIRHPIIRNYHNIISKTDYIKPEIGEYIILPTQEAIAILKTIWLRIIQRKWKKVYAERRKICHSISYLRNREIHSTCSIFPGLKGMLNNLKNQKENIISNIS